MSFDIQSPQFSESLPKTSHTAPSINKDLFELAFTHANFSTTIEEKIGALVIPHHLLAGRLIAETLVQAGTNNPITIVLISPDHFFAGKARMSTSLEDWETPYGRIKANHELILELTRTPPLHVDEKPFEREHGIYNLLPFIKKTFPNAFIVPIIIKSFVGDSMAEDLAKILSKHLPNDALIIASLDFSHEVTRERAVEQDAISQEILERRERERISEIAVDCQACILTLMSYTEKRQFTDFRLIENTNSADVLRQPKQPDVTSYIIGYFTK